MHLVIDIGNTLIKIGLFEKDNLHIHATFSHLEFEHEMLFLKKNYNISNVILSSVGKLSVEQLEKVLTLFECHILSFQSQLPFINKYQTPQTLGVDRIALAASAVEKFPNTNVLVIDAGTCITYDFVSETREYLGGAIAPGIQSRYKALHDYTAKLPLLEKEIPENFIGNNTNTSIHSGVVNGTAREIDGIIDQYSTYYEKLTVVLTGGDAEFLAKQLKNSIFVRPFFLLEGLYIISKLNINDKKN